MEIFHRKQAIVAAFKHNRNAFEIDYEGYAATLGLANAASGRTSWATLRKKLGVAAAGRISRVLACSSADVVWMILLTISAATIDPKSSDGATGTKKRKAAAEAEDENDEAGDDDNEEVPKTPKKKSTKVAKEKKGKKAAAPAVAEVEDDDEEEIVEKAPKKKAKATEKGKKGKKAVVKNEDDDDE